MDNAPGRTATLKANVELELTTLPDAHAPLPLRAIVFSGALLATVLLVAGVWIWIASTAVATPVRSPSLRSASAQPAQAASPETSGGNTIVADGCLEVGAHACLSADPRLHAAVQLLQTTTRGPGLLRTAADAGVAVRIGTPVAGSLAYFRPSTRTVTIGGRVAGSTARAQAAVLAHELQHVSDWSKVGPLYGNSLNCYQTEASAFTTEAGVWRELRGDQAPGNSLESNIESIARGVDSGKPKFWLGLATDYVDECLGG